MQNKGNSKVSVKRKISPLVEKRSQRCCKDSFFLASTSTARKERKKTAALGHLGCLLSFSWQQKLEEIPTYRWFSVCLSLLLTLTSGALELTDTATVDGRKAVKIGRLLIHHHHHHQHCSCSVSGWCKSLEHGKPQEDVNQHVFFYHVIMQQLSGSGCVPPPPSDSWVTLRRHNTTHQGSRCWMWQERTPIWRKSSAKRWLALLGTKWGGDQVGTIIRWPLNWHTERQHSNWTLGAKQKGVKCNWVFVTQRSRQSWLQQVWPTGSGVRGRPLTWVKNHHRVNHTSQRKGFSPECCREWTLRDMLRLKDLPQVSQVKGMSLVWAAGTGRKQEGRK